MDIESSKNIRPKISVCIVSYNHELFIEKCVNSVLNQRGRFALEILVGVDLSSDRTAEIVQRLAAQHPKIIKPFISEERIGFGSTNYQALLRSVSGDYIAHLDGDDFWHPDKLQRQLEFVFANPHCSAVYTNADVVNKNGRCVGVFNYKQPIYFTLDYLFERGSFLPQSSMFYRASMLNQVCQISSPYIDYHFSLVLAQHGATGYINQSLTSYRIDTTHSVRRTMNDHLRQQMWRAITSVDEEAIPAQTLVKAKSEFLRAIFFKSVSAKQPGLFMHWWIEVTNSVDSPTISLFAYTALAIFRQGLLEFWSRISPLIRKSRARVYYPR